MRYKLNINLYQIFLPPIFYAPNLFMLNYPYALLSYVKLNMLNVPNFMHPSVNKSPQLNQLLYYSFVQCKS